MPCSIARRGGLGGHLGGIRRGLAGALEAHLAGGGPGDHRTGRVGDRDDRVVERALDVAWPTATFFLTLRRTFVARACRMGGDYVPAFLPATVRFGPCGCGRWSWCADRARAGRGGGAGPRHEPISCLRRISAAISRRRSPLDLDVALEVVTQATSWSSTRSLTRVDGSTPSRPRPASTSCDPHRRCRSGRPRRACRAEGRLNKTMPCQWHSFLCVRRCRSSAGRGVVVTASVCRAPSPASGPG